MMYRQAFIFQGSKLGGRRRERGRRSLRRPLYTKSGDTLYSRDTRYARHREVRSNHCAQEFDLPQSQFDLPQFLLKRRPGFLPSIKERRKIWKTKTQPNIFPHGGKCLWPVGHTCHNASKCLPVYTTHKYFVKQLSTCETQRENRSKADTPREKTTQKQHGTNN